MSDSSVHISHCCVVHVKCLFWSTRSYSKGEINLGKWIKSSDLLLDFVIMLNCFIPPIRFESMEDGLPSRKAEEGGSSKRSQRQQERQGKLPRRRKEVKRSLRRQDCPEHLSGGSVHRLPEQHESEASASAEDTAESCPKRWDRCRYVTRRFISISWTH